MNPEPPRRPYWIGAVVLFLFVESFYAPAEQLSARAGILAIRGYQMTLSKVLRLGGGRCKYQPSCSEYGRQAIVKYGFLTGVSKTAARLWRCSPWGGPPGIDPP